MLSITKGLIAKVLRYLPFAVLGIFTLAIVIAGIRESRETRKRGTEPTGELGPVSLVSPASRTIAVGETSDASFTIAVPQLPSGGTRRLSGADLKVRFNKDVLGLTDISVAPPASAFNTLFLPASISDGIQQANQTGELRLALFHDSDTLFTSQVAVARLTFRGLANGASDISLRQEYEVVGSQDGIPAKVSYTLLNSFDGQGLSRLGTWIVGTGPSGTPTPTVTPIHSPTPTPTLPPNTTCESVGFFATGPMQDGDTQGPLDGNLTTTYQHFARLTPSFSGRVNGLLVKAANGGGAWRTIACKFTTDAATPANVSVEVDSNEFRNEAALAWRAIDFRGREFSLQQGTTYRLYCRNATDDYWMKWGFSSALGWDNGKSYSVCMQREAIVTNTPTPTRMVTVTPTPTRQVTVTPTPTRTITPTPGRTCNPSCEYL